jgi:ribosome biogenesis protein BMS1
MDDHQDSKRKEHRAKQAGPKARSKKSKEAKKQGISDSERKKNPKAFIFNSAVVARKARQRNADNAYAYQYHVVWI